jgi:hypothetical protein
VKRLFFVRMEPSILLVSKRDGSAFRVPTKGAQLSKLVQAALSDDQPAELTVDVAGDVLALVAAYMSYHQHSEPFKVECPLRSKRMADMCVDLWDADFIDQADPVALAQSAYYLDMPVLTHLCCAKIATKFWNRDPSQIHGMLKKERDG